VLTYLRPSRVKSRGRGRGTPGLGIAAVCIGSIGTALELLGGTLAALKFSDDQIKMVIVGGLPVAVCGVIVAPSPGGMKTAANSHRRPVGELCRARSPRASADFPLVVFSMILQNPLACASARQLGLTKLGTL